MVRTYTTSKRVETSKNYQITTTLRHEQITTERTTPRNTPDMTLRDRKVTSIDEVT
jgi:hypothetical protein